MKKKKVYDNDHRKIPSFAILVQFSKSKERHFEEVKSCLAEMEELQSKKNLYKKLGQKLKQVL